jgi:hypothetical protein
MISIVGKNYLLFDNLDKTVRIRALYPNSLILILHTHLLPPLPV